MLSENKRFRSLKATLYSTYIDFKTPWYLFIGIVLGLIIMEFVLLNLNSRGSSSSNLSPLNSGFVTALWVVGISMIVITSNVELMKKFSFPVDRKNLAIAHILYIFISPLVLLLTSCGLYLIEFLLSGVAGVFFPGFIYDAIITKGSFLTGFFVSWIVVVSLSSIIYCVFMYFYRYKLATAIAVGIPVALCFNVKSIGQIITALFNDIFLNSSPFLLIFKLLGISILFLAVAYIPLKRMEVKS